VLIRIALSLLPVLTFVLLLVVLDSYKLVRLRAVLIAISAGALAAAACFLINRQVLSYWPFELSIYSRYAAPFLEELTKAAYMVILIRRQRIGFMVDAGILGAAIGAGFAGIENVYYLYSIADPNPMTWVVRGFGTAVMHAGTTAIFSIITVTAKERRPSSILPFVFGFGCAMFLHSIFNHFVLPPLVSTGVLVLTLPPLVVLIFARSEKSLEKWLGVGFDSDVQLFETIVSGGVLQTKVGQYLTSLKQHFPGEILADMLCLLRLHLELSIKAKGVLLMREAGYEVPPSPEVRGMFDELRYLEKSIGPTGKLALAPVLHKSSRELWELHMLKEA